MAGQLVGLFEQFSPRLKALPEEYRKHINEIMFAMRDGKISVAVGTPNISTFRDIVTGAHPLDSSLYSENNNRFGVDLDNLHDDSDTYRIYVTNRTTNRNETFFIGYYVKKENGGFTTRKEYYKMENIKGTIAIRRFDETNTQIGYETESSTDSWKGPMSIENVAKANGLFYHFMKKNEKDQTYIRIVDETV